MQIEWFRSIDNLTNFYFVINFKGINGGLINISQIDYKNNSAHSGLFLAEGHFRNTPIPILASLSLLKFGFDMLGLNEIFAKVGVNNKTAYEYNTALGFSFMKHLNEGFDLLKIDKNSFENPVIKFDKLIGVSALKRMQLVFNKNRGQDDSIRELIFQFLVIGTVITAISTFVSFVSPTDGGLIFFSDHLHHAHFVASRRNASLIAYSQRGLPPVSTFTELTQQ